MKENSDEKITITRGIVFPPSWREHQVFSMTRIMCIIIGNWKKKNIIKLNPEKRRETTKNQWKVSSMLTIQGNNTYLKASNKVYRKQRD